MIIIVPIILILILAFIAFCNGDTSGIEAIGKVILYIALFLIVVSIITYAPWLIVVVVIILIMIGCSSK